ncbi:MAG: mannonate dehydratase [Synergistaceae bacterium]|nr:mannonate dehydratase [Synergistaceae bacterium]MBR1603980.1 mannonate dehydratase [Synergistaceae bacterium]
MKMTFRWYGSASDPIPLKYIKQIPGMTGLMGLLDKPAGVLWEDNEIKSLVDEVHAAGLELEVIESVNVHEDIKIGLPSRDEYIENYIKTIRNLAKHGIKVIIYNFMPVFDWLRTDLARVIEEDGSNSLYFNEKDLGEMGPLEIVRKTAESSQGFTLPGWEPERLALLEQTLKQYEGMTPDTLRKNYKYFLDAVIPVSEECGVKMACHPDDPAWDIFGLPRIAHSQADYDKIVALHDSPANTVCLCTGSLGSNPDNNIPAIIRHFGTMNRIGAMHVRNVKFLGWHHFREAAHLSSTGDLDMYAIMKAIYDTCPDVYIRPDHGRMIWEEADGKRQARAGYGLYDRALGAAYLNGLWEAIDKAAKGC